MLDVPARMRLTTPYGAAGEANDTSVCGNSGSQVAHQMVHLVLAVKGFYASTRADSALTVASGRFVANLALQFGMGILP